MAKKSKLTESPARFTSGLDEKLPTKPSGEQFKMITAAEAKAAGNVHLAGWLEKCEKQWTTRRKEKAGKVALINWLNYRNKITQQRHTAKFKVLYPTSATNLCSAVVPNENITLTVQGQKVTLQKFVAESKTYYFETDSESEAHYLSAILNSNSVDQLIKPMQEHQALAELGKRCAETVKKSLPSLDTEGITPGKIGRLRQQVREVLKQQLAEIDGMVRGMVGG
jgi:hypothetical protein